ncbi:MAG: right-handed parallel beta-helix repeat-containing protein [Flavobacteriales bacterium]|nr:right-handed parallel beta-helix repeat-containing protein [Flavobacteriales bacterium]
MSRSARHRLIGARAWLMAVAMVAMLLFVGFRFVDTDRLAGDWPLGIEHHEVDGYAALLDWRSDTASGTAERYLISSAPEACLMEERGPGWNTHWFEAEGFGDSVEVRRLRTEPGGFVIKFKRSEPFRSQRHIVLSPARVSSMRAKYLEILADELGLITPEVSFVRIIACGKDQGLFLKEERIDDDFLEKRGLPGAALAEFGHDASRPDHLFPDFDDDSLAMTDLTPVLARAYGELAAGRTDLLPYLVDARAAGALLVMAWIEHGPSAFDHAHVMAYDWSRGRLVPLYRRSRANPVAGTAVPFRMSDPLTLAIVDGTIRQYVRERWSKLSDEAWRVRERFAAIDRAWLPILAEGQALAVAQARMKQIQEELLGSAMLAADPIKGLEASLARHAGDASLSHGLAPTGYWPGEDDAAILVRIAQRTKAFVRGDTLVFPRGRYLISSDLTVPYGHALVMEPGARIEIAAGASVMVQGPLQVRGTKRNPVFIRPAEDGAPYGSFAVIGDGSIDVRIEGLQMSGGSEVRLNGVYASGMLAIHGAAGTIMQDCVISGSHGEDLMNIKGGEVQLRDCIFENGHADLLDLDRCTGVVDRSVFRNGLADANGDGLDVSASRILVTGCTFSNLKDKGISVGEASQVLAMDSRFDGNAAALVSKDLSVAFASGNRFTGNGVAFAAYRKKPIYGGARLVRYTNVLEANARDEQADEQSAIITEAVLDEKVRRMFGMP